MGESIIVILLLHNNHTICLHAKCTTFYVIHDIVILLLKEKPLELIQLTVNLLCHILGVLVSNGARAETDFFCGFGSKNQTFLLLKIYEKIFLFCS